MLPEEIWRVLVRRAGRPEMKVTPFLGAGSCFPALPLGDQVAQEMAAEYGYPFPDSNDLMRVAQYVAVSIDPNEPKEWLLRRLSSAAPPVFARDEPHHVLAQLPLPLYLTTNYDDFMVQALRSLTPVPRAPRREYCRWHEGLEDESTVFEGGFVPDPANPLVFHLHGHTRPESLVLTEDDYIQFLTRIGNVQTLLPQPVRQAIRTNTFLFIGYRLADWNFRILFNGLRALQPTLSIAVLKPHDDPVRAEKEKLYMDKRYGRMNLIVCWETARNFCAELKRRCDAALSGSS
jgi:hypothetical protein